MRGVVSLAAALALPIDLSTGEPFPARDLIIFLTFCVILATLVVQGLTLAPLTHWLDLHDGNMLDNERRIGWRRAAEAALAHLADLSKNQGASEDALVRSRQRLEAQIALCDDHSASVAVQTGRASLYSHMSRVEREIVRVKRHTIVKLRNEGEVSTEVASEILRDLDLSEASLH